MQWSLRSSASRAAETLCVARVPRPAAEWWAGTFRQFGVVLGPAYFGRARLSVIGALAFLARSRPLRRPSGGPAGLAGGARRCFLGAGACFSSRPEDGDPSINIRRLRVEMRLVQPKALLSLRQDLSEIQLAP